MDISEIVKELKIALVEANMTMPQLVNELHEKYNRSEVVQVFTNKLNNRTIKLVEILEAFDVLGYKITFSKNK